MIKSKLNYFFVKRLLDIIISIILLLLTFPVLIFFSLLIIIYDCQFPLFSQERSGIFGKKIKIYKLQTIINKDNTIQISKLGRFLRFSKIDELPQLFNVLKNDLSLVGPRPLYLEYNKFYSDYHLNRISTKPGITGYSQIKLINSNDWFDKFDHDIYYVKNQNLSFDIMIIFESILLIINLLFSKNKVQKKVIDSKEDFYRDYYEKLNNK